MSSNGKVEEFVGKMALGGLGFMGFWSFFLFLFFVAIFAVTYAVASFSTAGLIGVFVALFLIIRIMKHFMLKPSAKTQQKGK